MCPSLLSVFLFRQVAFFTWMTSFHVIVFTSVNIASASAVSLCFRLFYFFDIAICFDLLVNLLVTRYVLISFFSESLFRNFYFHHVNVLFF